VAQAAYGIMCEVESHPFPLDEMLFMDWRAYVYHVVPLLGCSMFTWDPSQWLGHAMGDGTDGIDFCAWRGVRAVTT